MQNNRRVIRHVVSAKKSKKKERQKERKNATLWRERISFLSTDTKDANRTRRSFFNDKRRRAPLPASYKAHEIQRESAATQRVRYHASNISKYISQNLCIDEIPIK